MTWLKSLIMRQNFAPLLVHNCNGKRRQIGDTKKDQVILSASGSSSSGSKTLAPRPANTIGRRARVRAGGRRPVGESHESATSGHRQLEEASRQAQVRSGVVKQWSSDSVAPLANCERSSPNTIEAGHELATNPLARLSLSPELARTPTTTASSHRHLAPARVPSNLAGRQEVGGGVTSRLEYLSANGAQQERERGREREREREREPTSRTATRSSSSQLGSPGAGRQHDTRMWARARLTATLGHQRLASGARLALVCLVALIISQECWQAVWGSAASQQYFEVQPEAQNLVANGQEARLRCLVRNRQGECAWIRNGLVIGPIKSKYSYARQPDDGDCSILIRNASVQLDDGLWQCQVLATELDQPALQSRQVSLVVVVAPERPQFKDAPRGQRLVIEENSTKFVVCEMRGGNPAPQIEWLLDNKNISKEAQSSSLVHTQQAAAPAGGQQVQRVTQSRLQLSDIRRSMNGKNLTCVGVHPTLNQSASVELDVQYVPSVSVLQKEYSIVEGSPLSISCQVDANPAPSLVSWRLVSEGPPTLTSAKKGEPKSKVPNTSGPVLEFQHIGRDSNQDVYECLAQNAHGVSAPADVKLNVLFAPAVLNSSHSESVLVGSQAQLACLFEGNPQPEIRWFYTDPLSKSASTLQLDNDRKSALTIKNVTYRNEGDYFCEARNYINGQAYSVRSSNILLDVFGEPQFLVKSPVHAKAVQGSRSDVALTFCSDPPPHKVYWQFGSIRLDVRLNNINNGAQLTQQVAPATGGQPKLHHHQAGVVQRFQVHPLLPIQRRDSNFAKVQTCFEASLSLLDPELTDQRDYTLNVFNERGHQSGTVRLRVTSPLSPVLMITSAFVTICGLFLCSLFFMFVFKKRQQFLTGSAGLSAAGSPAGSQRAANEKGRAGANGKLANGNGLAASLNAQQHQQQQTLGTVSGAGNGLANGASNPNGLAGQTTLDADQTKALHMLSMASSDTSCNDQKQLLANLDRNSSASGSTSGGGNHNHCNDYNVNLASTNSTDRSTANSTPTPMNHISVDDELHINGTYQAAESVTRGARLSPPPGSHALNPNRSGLIYANLDYTNHLIHHGLDNSAELTSLTMQQQRPTLRRQQTPIDCSPTGSNLTINDNHQANNLSPANSIGSSSNNTGTSNNGPISNNGNNTNGTRSSSVGATIAMMNSLAAAAAGQGISSPGSGVLNGAINQQLANSRQIRKPGPPKPPKPSIQQRSRFYQQQVATAAATSQTNNNSAGLVMIGSQPQQHGYPMSQPSGQQQQQQNHMTIDGDKQVTANELAVEYSRLAFPARAEL